MDLALQIASETPLKKNLKNLKTKGSKRIHHRKDIYRPKKTCNV